MADNARELTDKRLAAMSKRLTSEYKTAQKDLSDRFSKYMSESEKRLESLKTALSEAVKSGDKKAIAKAEKALAQAKMNMTIGNKRYREMIDDLTTKMAEVNQTALDYVNGQMSYIYRVNYNQGRDAADEIGMSFSAMNEDAVARRVRDGDIKLPKKKMSIPEDKRWNTKQLNSAVIQGIMQGESMDKIAKRILPVVDNNRNAAIRNARTMVTGAENEGRQDCWEQLAEDGAVLKRVWISTPDSRTREAHLFMDGQEVDLDEPFVDGDGNQLNFPGDPTAAPETVYNCRCSMRVKVIGFRKKDGDIVRVAERDRQGMHQKAIEREREKREAEEKPKFTITTKDIHKPHRPKAADYKGWDDFKQANDEFHKQKAQYLEEVQRFVDEQSAIPSMSIDEVNKWCSDNNISVSNDISEVDGKLMTAYTSRMNKLINDFPDVMTQWDNVPTEEKKYILSYEKGESYLAEATHGMHFGVNCNDFSYVLKQQVNDVADGYRVAGDGTINQFFDHEFGHLLHNKLFLDGRNWDVDFAYDNAWKEKNKRLEEDLMKSVSKKSGNSDYSTTNSHELFAEAFSAWYGGEKTEFAQAFGDFLKRWIK